MDLDKLLAELDGIGRIARSWKEQDRVAEIERQIILDKLRHIYEKVMFSGGVEVCEALPGSRRHRKRQIVSVLRLVEQPDRLSHLYRLLKRMNPSLA